MIKKLLTVVAIAALFASCNNAGTNEGENNADSTDVAVIEETITEIPLAEFDAKAAEFVDKTVIVTGIVDHICKHGGKKLFLVADSADVHIESDTKFDDEIEGSELTVTAIVTEFRVDERYCLQQEEDFIKQHSEGVDSDEMFERKKEHIAEYRDSMKAAGVDHLSFYSLQYVSHVVNE